MKIDYTFFQGATCLVDAKTLSSTFVMSDGLHKYTGDHLITTDQGLKIELPHTETSGFVPGIYTYQVINETGLEAQGKLKVKPNLLYADDIASYWKKVVDAIDKKLAGKADEIADSVTVGDKSIRYMSIDELLKLRNFALQRLSEEDEEAFSPINERRILYTTWGTIR